MLTIVTYLAMVVICVMEFRMFMSSDFTTTLSLDRADSENLQVNFNVDLLDIECRNLKMAYVDEFGVERIGNVASDFTVRAIDASGRPQGAAFRPDPEPVEEITDAKRERKKMEVQ